MHISISKLGVMECLEYDIGGLTIICGKNNMGKTYVTHATYGLFDYIRSDAKFRVPPGTLERLLETGTTGMPLGADTIRKAIHATCEDYGKILHDVLAGSERHFQGVKISLEIGSEKGTGPKIRNQARLALGKGAWLEGVCEPGTSTLSVSLVTQAGEGKNEGGAATFNKEFIAAALNELLLGMLLRPNIPRPFISSVERTGAAIFQKELDFTASGLLNVLRNMDKKGLAPAVFMRSFASRYPLAVKRNVDFIRELSSLDDQSSFIAREHPDVLGWFEDIIGGQYQVARDGSVQFQPKGGGHASRLALVESSSAVRSLLDVQFYLRHIAAPGDLFMIDEPELNLHPENQRKVARLFARLSNLGVKVFMTTHSDYILKEFNTLLMLNKPDERLQKLAKREGYDRGELLTADNLRVYTAKEDSILKPGAKRKTTCPTLVPAAINQDEGIEMPSFDKTIDEMNRIQDEILWGEE